MNISASRNWAALAEHQKREFFGAENLEDLEQRMPSMLTIVEAMSNLQADFHFDTGKVSSILFLLPLPTLSVLQHVLAGLHKI